MSVMTWAAVCAVLAAAQPAPETRFATLETLLRPLASQVGCTLAMPKELAGRPVIYYFHGEQPPADRVQDIARILNLTAVFNAEARTLTISRSNSLRPVNLRQRRMDAVSRLQREMAPYGGLLAEQAFQASIAALRSGRDLSNEDYRQLVGFSEKLRQLSDPLGRLALLPLLRTGPAELADTLGRPASQKNHLKMTAEGSRLADHILSGRTVQPDEFMSREGLTEAEWDNVKAVSAAGRMALGRIPPEAELSYTHEADSIWVFCVTPKTAAKVAVAALDVPSGSAAAPPAQTVLPGWTQDFALRLPFRRGTADTTINALGNAAPGMNLSYVGWMGHWLPEGGGGGSTLEWHLTQGIAHAMGVRGSIENGWLVLRRFHDLWPDYQGDWRPFERLYPLMEEGGTIGEWRTAFNSFGPTEMTDLEQTFSSHLALQETYRTATSGAFLARAALREMEITGQDRLEKPLAEVSPAVLDDVYSFYNGPWIWSHARWLLHSQNLRKRPDVILYASPVTVRDAPVLRIGLRYPAGKFDFLRDPEIQFDLPLKAGR